MDTFDNGKTETEIKSPLKEEKVVKQQEKERLKMEFDTSTLSDVPSEIGKENPVHPPTPSSIRLKRLPGSANLLGVDYEFKLAGLVDLRLRTHGFQFQVHSNVSKANPFDDIVLKTSTQWPQKKLHGSRQWVTYFMQLKHTTKDPLVTKMFTNDKHFGLKKYFNFFLDLRQWHKNLEEGVPIDAEQRVLCQSSLQDCRFIIYTTRRAWKDAACRVEVEGSIHSVLQGFLHSGGENSLAVHFTEKDDDVWNLMQGDPNEAVYQKEFLPLLCVFCGQSVSNGLDSLIHEEIQNVFGAPLPNINVYFPQYIESLKQWAQDKRKDYCLTESSGELEWILAVDLRQWARWAAGGGAIVFCQEHCASLERSLISQGSLSVIVEGMPPGHRAAKLLQLLDTHFESSWLYVSLEVLSRVPAKAIEAVCNGENCKVLVMDVDSVEHKVQYLFNAVKYKVKIVKVSSTFQKTFLTKESFFDEEWKLNHLTEKSQERMLEREMVFQGKTIKLCDLQPMWPELCSEVDGSLLSALVKGSAEMGACLLPSTTDDALFIPRTMQHMHILDPTVLCRLNPKEDHLALSGFAHGDLKSLAQSLELAETEKSERNNRWTALDFKEHELPREHRMTFQSVCNEHMMQNVHWIERIDEGAKAHSEMTLAWRSSYGHPDVLFEYMVHATSGCTYRTFCTHSGRTATCDAAAWGERTALLIGAPGAGKSMFLRHVAAKAHERAPEHWTIFVEVLLHRKLLRDMPNAADIGTEHMKEIVAAAAGVTNKGSRRCLEAALFRSGAVIIFVDGADEICPTYREKMLQILRLLIHQTKIRLVWVGSRPEIREALQQVMCCATVSLVPLTKDEQSDYMSAFWASHSGDFSCTFKSVANEVVKDINMSLSRDVVDKNLLDDPLHVHMAAEILLDDSIHSEGRLRKIQKLNLNRLFRSFVDQKQKKFLERHGFNDSNLENSTFSENSSGMFEHLHQICAMALLTSDGVFPEIDPCIFRDDIIKNLGMLHKEKTGILWIDEERSPHFIHYSFVEFFSAAWLCENSHSNNAVRDAIHSLFMSNYQRRLRLFLELMLTDGFPLHEALLAEDDRAFNIAMSSDVSVDKVDRGGRLPLHLAVSNDYWVKILLSKGCDPNHQDTLMGWVPMNYLNASLQRLLSDRWFIKTERTVAAWEQLLKAGAKRMLLTAVSVQRQAVMCNAIDNDHTEILKLMMDSEVNEDLYIQSLYVAEKLGKAHILKLLITLYCTCCRRQDSSSVKNEDTNFNTEDCIEPLHAEDSQEFIDTTEMLSKTPPLTLAVLNDNLLRVERLLEDGSDINVSNLYGFTALHYAAGHGSEKMINLLLSSGADVNLRTKLGNTALYFATIHGNLKCVSSILRKDSDPWSQNNIGETWLHTAVKVGNTDIIQNLLKSEKDLKLLVKQDTTFSLAQLYYDVEVSGNETDLNDVKENMNLMTQNINSENSIQSSVYREDFESKTDEGMTLLLKNSQENMNSQTFDGKTPLFLAAMDGNLECVQCLLECGVDPNVSTYDGLTPLHVAVEKEHCEIVKVLVSYVDVNSLTVDHSTPLFLAAKRGKLKSVKCLLANDSDPCIADDRGFSPLHAAAQRGHSEIIQEILTHGMDVNSHTLIGETSLLLAAKSGNLECVECLLARGADLNIPDENGSTPLHVSARAGHSDITGKLIFWGAGVNSLTKDGSTPLLLAAGFGKLECAECLLENNSNPRITDNECFTPLHAASLGGHWKIIQKILAYSEDVNALTNSGETPLFLATKYKHLECVEYLLAIGADVNISDVSGKAPLHSAAQVGASKLIEKLILFGANVNSLTKNGSTPLLLAAKYGKSECVECLLACGSDINLSDENGLIPLHVAAQKGHYKIIQKLIVCGSDVNSLTKLHDTALLLAAQFDWLKCVECLLTNGANPNIGSEDGFTSLHAAVKNGNYNMIQSLLHYQADVNAQNTHGTTALLLAAEYGYFLIFEILMNAGAHIDGEDCDGDTSLLLAAWRGNKEIVNLLLHLEVPQEANNAGRTPLHCASEEGHTEIVLSLMQTGGSVNTKDLEGNTPLFLAVRNGHFDCAKLLLENGCNPNETNFAGANPLQLCVNCVEMQQLLLHAGATQQ